MKTKSLVFALMFLPMISWAETTTPEKNKKTEITMTTTQAMQLAGALANKGDFDQQQEVRINLGFGGISK